MPSAVVEIRKKFLDAGKARGAVIDATGTRYSVKAVNMGDIQEGGVYELFWEDKSYQGKPWRDVQTIKAHQSKTAPAAAKVLGNIQQAREDHIEKLHMQKWVGERIDALIAASLCDGDTSSMASKGREVLAAYHLIFSDKEIPENTNEPQAKQPFNEEMGDDIPY